MSTTRRSGLGRGLAALIPPEPDKSDGEREEASQSGRAVEPARAAATTGSVTVADLAITAITANPRQPREVFDDSELEGLATSLRDVGVLQPLVVRPRTDGSYELVAGERRLRAAFIAGLETVPAVIRHTDDGDLLKEALVENIHRVQLNPLEEAAALQQLLEDFGFSQEELARRLGKSRPVISNALRLLTLPTDVQRRVAAGVLSAGHAKALLALDDRDAQVRFAERIVAEGLSVRATEELVRLHLVDDDGISTSRRRGKERDRSVAAPALIDLQDDLSHALQARVRVTMGTTKGRMQVEFATIDDLERIVSIIARGLDNSGAISDALDVAVDVRELVDGDD